MGPRQVQPREYGGTTVLGRAWSGLASFFSEFTGGPAYRKGTARTARKPKVLKTELQKRAKSVTIKPEPKELKRYLPRLVPMR